MASDGVEVLPEALDKLKRNISGSNLRVFLSYLRVIVKHVLITREQCALGDMLPLDLGNLTCGHLQLLRIRMQTLKQNFVVEIYVSKLCMSLVRL
jgi:hypothetical protein